ncbi:lipoprotein [Spiroplasma tabanidicola]|uniref:Spiralin n=1 Tax=Spiroplasma tabanidicola TaxID=324079 RepID=A0A6I6CDF1_9MOLU|nr:lipoprotein [Spiroplasma tabanidicola]QGS52152.1 hypothetical protein STABA_v1c07960 [Spiroplasma tabanidicola]
MKKLLSLLGAMGMVAASSSVAVACKNDKSSSEPADLSKLTAQSLTVAPTANDEAAAKVAVITKIKTELSKQVVETTDVIFDRFSAATKEKAGSIIVKAAEKSNLVTGTATFTLTFKDSSESSTDPQPEQSPELSFVTLDHLQNNVLELQDKNPVTVTIKVANKKADAQVQFDEISEKPQSFTIEANESNAVNLEEYKFNISSSAVIAENGIKITFKYSGANNLELTVKTKSDFSVG